MSFLNPTPVPVTLYSSTDPDAPQLPTKDWTVAIKTILKACLVTGYGGKAGAGWQIRDEEANKATFIPTDPEAPQVGLIVHNAHRDNLDLDLLFDGVAQSPTNLQVLRSVRPNADSISWRLLATARGFIFVPLYLSRTGTHAAMLCFGGMRHNLVNPAGQNFVLWNTLSFYSYQTPSTALSELSSRSKVAISFGALSNPAPAGGLSKNTFLYSHVQNDRQILSRSDAHKNILQAKLYSQLYLAHSAGVIGVIPGLLIASHRTMDDKPDEIMRIDDSPHDWLFTDHTSNWANPNDIGVSILINTQEWIY